MTVVTGAGLVINVLLNILLIPELGIKGAALASLVSYTMGGIGCLALFRRVTRASVELTIERVQHKPITDAALSGRS
jgi:Na+-driven multidrug efflux pump